jgi:hypothetical protein
MQSGRLRKLFCDKSKPWSEDKLPRSMRISSSDKLHLLRTSLPKEQNLKTEARSKLFGDIHDEKLDNKDSKN